MNRKTMMNENKYVYERCFALSPQSRVTDREQLQTWWKQQDTSMAGYSYLTKAVNDELSFYKSAGAEQVDSAEFVFTDGREGEKTDRYILYRDYQAALNLKRFGELALEKSVA